MEKETIGQWTTELRTREANCEFQESDNMIKDNIAIGIRDRPVQEKLLREYDLTLEKALDICSASETSKEQYQAMSSLHQQDIAVYDIRAGEKRGQKQGHYQKSRFQRQCKYCGSTNPPLQCPAYNKKCNLCGCLNQSAKVDGRK